MNITHSLAAALLVATSAAFPALAQDAATQAILDANQQAAVQQVQQYNEQMRQVASDNADQARKSMSQHDNGGAIDLDRLFGLVPQESAPVVASPQATTSAPHHRYHHRRRHSS